MQLVGDHQQFMFQGLGDVKVDSPLPFGVNFLSCRLDFRPLLLVCVGIQRDAAIGRSTPVLPIEGGLEDRPQLVVVTLRDRIITMVMTLSTVDRHAHQRRADDLYRVGDHLVTRQLNVNSAGGRTVGSHP